MSKEKKPTETRLYDPGLADADFVQNNLLSLPSALKAYLTENGMDWRFLNAKEFRQAGGVHRSQWQPLKVPSDLELGLTAVTAERHIQRGDLILGIRPKTITAKHKEALTQKNRAYSNFGKTQAKELKEHARRVGLGDHVKISEGYEDDGRGYKGPDTED